ncbi:MAG: hypothetical protein ACQCN3_13650 [Candidatus Bathyarchaeia archaeon]|jgi:hypothetical protein
MVIQVETEKKWCRKTLLLREAWRNLTTLDVTKSLKLPASSGYLIAFMVEVKKRMLMYRIEEDEEWEEGEDEEWEEEEW